MKKLLIILIITLFFSCKPENVRQNLFKKGDVVWLDNKLAVITDFGNATDWEIKLIDCSKNCYLNVNEESLEKYIK